MIIDAQLIRLLETEMILNEYSQLIVSQASQKMKGTKLSKEERYQVIQTLLQYGAK